MLSIEAIYEEKRKNPRLSFIDILAAFQEKYQIEEDVLLSFIRKNKTFYNELQRECQELKLLKPKVFATATISLDKIFGN